MKEQFTAAYRTDGRAQDSLEFVARSEFCDWCRYPHKPVYRNRLCRHCYGIKVELKRLHQMVQCKRSPLPQEIELKYRVALAMAESAQAEGLLYGSPDKQDVSPLKLEREFGFLSKKFLKRDLYEHKADLFECYTPTERKHLYYVVSRMSREYLRRNRRRQAQFDVSGRTVEEVLRERARGTYRVERDL